MAVSRGPLDWSTTVDADKSVMECVQLLRKHGATHVAMVFGPDRQPDGLEFIVATPWGPRGYELPVNVKGCQAALHKAWQDGLIDRRFQLADQARRVAWRQVKDWLAAQLALIDAGQLSLPQVMLPFTRTGDDRTLWGDITQRWALEAGSGS